jgi:Co/Zn/Cd efflux system component
LEKLRKQLKAAHFQAGSVILATSVIVDVIRRFMFGSEPESFLMIGIAALALIANFYCIYLMSHQKNDGAHMKASWVFLSNDIIVNLGVYLPVTCCVDRFRISRSCYRNNCFTFRT